MGRHLKVGSGLSPLLRLLEDYRTRCDVPIAIMVLGLNTSRLTYYNWMSGKHEPHGHNQRACRVVGAALKRAFDNQDLPYPRTRELTKQERESRIKEIVLRYIEEIDGGGS